MTQTSFLTEKCRQGLVTDLIRDLERAEGHGGAILGRLARVIRQNSGFLRRFPDHLPALIGDAELDPGEIEVPAPMLRTRRGKGDRERLILTIPAHAGGGRCCDWSPDGRRYARSHVASGPTSALPRSDSDQGSMQPERRRKPREIAVEACELAPVLYRESGQVGICH